MRKKFLNAMQKILPENSLPLPRNRRKKRKDFTQSWRQWPCLLKAKIRITSYRFSQS